MNVAADPCDDFYSFACGSGLKTTAEAIKMNSEHDKQSIVKNQLIEILSEPVSNDTVMAFRKAKTLYRACTNSERREELGLCPARKVLTSIGGWPLLDDNNVCNNSSKCDWNEITFKLMDVGVYSNYLADIGIVPDVYGRSTWTLMATRPGYNVDSTLAELLNEDFLYDYRRKFKHIADMLMDTAGRSASISRLDLEVAQMVDFEVALSKIAKNEDTWTNFTVDALKSRYPFVPWTAYFYRLLPSGVHLADSDVVVIEDPAFLDALQELLQNTSDRTVANYVVGRVLMEDVLPHLNAESRRAVKSFASDDSASVQEKCLDMVHESMPILTTSMYVRRHIRGEVRAEVTEMVSNIMREMRLLLQNEAWLDEDTRRAMKEKMANMKYFVGYPDQLLNDTLLDEFYSEVDVQGENLLEIVLSLSKLSFHHFCSKFNTTLAMMDWDLPITWAPMTLGQFINAQYTTITNSLTIFPGFLSDLYKPGHLDSITYGALGTVIGHEISHALDTDGSSRNGLGMLEDLWKNSDTKKTFQQRVQSIAEQFGNISIPGVTAPVNGTISRDENMADITGQLLAYRAYVRLREAKGGEEAGLRIPPQPKDGATRKEGHVLSARQLFWVSYASVYCSVYNPNLLNVELFLDRDDPHLPNIFRVTGSLRNHKEFANDFACPARARMNPDTKRLVWGSAPSNEISHNA